MNILKSKIIIISFIILFFLNCGKKNNNTKLAQINYKMALLEISGDNDLILSYRKALDLINKAIEYDYKTEYLALKATLLFKLGQNEYASELFDKVLSRKLSEKLKAEVLNNKACLLAKIGFAEKDSIKIQNALNIWENLEKNNYYLTPEVAIVNQSNIFIWQKNFEKAKEKLLQAIYIAPNYLDSHYYLASLAYFLQEYDLAKLELSTVLFLEPDHNGALELQDILRKV